MRHLKKLVVFVLLIFVGLSCSDSATDPNSDDDPSDDGDDPTEEVTVDDDIDNIESAVDVTITSLENLRDGEFTANMETFMNSESSYKIGSGLEAILDTESIESNRRFDFNAHTGVYSWQSDTEEWSETSESDNIILEFPSSQSVASNDMMFEVSEYSDSETTIDGEQYYLPTRIQSQLENEGDLIFGFNLNELEYSSNDLPLPNTLDLEIITAPLTHAITFSRDNSTEFSFSFDLLENDELTAGIALNLEVAHDNYSSLHEEDLENLTATLQFSDDLSLDAEMELGSLLTAENPTEDDINSLFTAEVLYEDSKIADLEYSEEEDTFIIIYRDGSSESIDRYFEDFSEDIEKAYSNLDKKWIDIQN